LGRCIATSARAVHRALFVRGGQHHHWRAQRIGRDALHGFDRERQERLHVRAAQAVQLAVARTELKGIALPERRVVGHGIGVASQDQAALPATVRRDQVLLVRLIRERQHLDAKASVIEQVRQHRDHLRVALVPARRCAADRGLGD
jgi:hypothetical protein